MIELLVYFYRWYRRLESLGIVQTGLWENLDDPDGSSCPDYLYVHLTSTGLISETHFI